MEEIEVGEYVRTKNQGIKRVDTIFPNKTVNKYGYEIGSEWDGKLYSTIKTTDIVKHSKNIIDLIEVGDYVNGREVKNIAMFEGFPDYPKLIFVDEKHLIPGETAENKDIKSIVTHEQFASMEYKVGE